MLIVSRRPLHSFTDLCKDPDKRYEHLQAHLYNLTDSACLKNKLKHVRPRLSPKFSACFRY